MKPTLILINPWIYDFAAYDLWSRPLGLLHLAGSLRSWGFQVHLVDCLDIHHPLMGEAAHPHRRSYGTGKYWRTSVPRPLPLLQEQRTYSRYGISPDAFREDLKGVESPSAVLVTSMMTYWYPGVVEAVQLAKEIHPEIPVILGGTYARLCHEHAVKNSGADHVSLAKGAGELPQILESLGIPLPVHPSKTDPHPYPAFDLLSPLDCVCLLTSAGCPYRCSYCASSLLQPGFSQQDPHRVLEEILYWHGRFGVQDFAFYDDALLVSSEDRLAVLLEEIVKRRLPLRFHTPNALHAREITADLARLMKASGFRTVRLGLETSDFSHRRELDNKLSEGEFERAAGNLLRAGFSGTEVGAYILLGLPGQSAKTVLETIRFTGGAGVTPYLSEFSPIPHTSLWETAIARSRYPLSEEPLYQNNTLFPCWDEKERGEVPRLKKTVLEIRRKLRALDTG
jgi:radical SAM superfamily enzyme YgiQ (UPF0313 family)